MELTVENTFAAPVIPGVEDKFYYVISEDCVMCASCAEACPVQVKCPERSEPLGFGHPRVFLVFPFIYAVFRAFAFSTGIGHIREKSSKSKRETKKFYDLDPFVHFVWFVNPHVHCNNI